MIWFLGWSYWNRELVLAPGSFDVHVSLILTKLYVWKCWIANRILRAEDKLDWVCSSCGSKIRTVHHLYWFCLCQVPCLAVLDPVLEIGGWVSSRPWDRGEGSPIFFFSPLQASVWSKNKGDPERLPWIRHCLVLKMRRLKVKRDSSAQFKRCLPASVSLPDWIPLCRKIQIYVMYIRQHSWQRVSSGPSRRTIKRVGSNRSSKT